MLWLNGAIPVTRSAIIGAFLQTSGLEMAEPVHGGHILFVCIVNPRYPQYIASGSASNQQVAIILETMMDKLIASNG